MHPAPSTTPSAEAQQLINFDEDSLPTTPSSGVIQSKVSNFEHPQIIAPNSYMHELSLISFEEPSLPTTTSAMGQVKVSGLEYNSPAAATSSTHQVKCAKLEEDFQSLEEFQSHLNHVRLPGSSTENNEKKSDDNITESPLLCSGNSSHVGDDPSSQPGHRIQVRESSSEQQVQLMGTFIDARGIERAIRTATIKRWCKKQKRTITVEDAPRILRLVAWKLGLDKKALADGGWDQRCRHIVGEEIVGLPPCLPLVQSYRETFLADFDLAAIFTAGSLSQSARARRPDSTFQWSNPVENSNDKYHRADQ